MVKGNIFRNKYPVHGYLFDKNQINRTVLILGQVLRIFVLLLIQYSLAFPRIDKKNPSAGIGRQGELKIR